MLIDILSLFPQIAAAPLRESMIGKAQERGLVTIRSHNLRDWTTDKHRTTDDTPYGGSQGMVLKCEPIFAAVEELRNAETAPPPCDSLHPDAEGPSSLPKSSFLNPQSTLVLLLSPAGRISGGLSGGLAALAGAQVIELVVLVRLVRVAVALVGHELEPRPPR